MSDKFEETTSKATIYLVEDESKKSSRKSRKGFVKNIGLIGPGGVALSASLYSAKKFEEKKGQSVKLLTALCFGLPKRSLLLW